MNAAKTTPVFVIILRLFRVLRGQCALAAPSRLVRRPSVRGFTLVELLVVIAVIAVIAAMLFPAFGRAKTSAQRVRCISNLRQLGLAARMYCDDHDDAFFRYRGGSTNNGEIFWFGWLERGAEGKRAFDPSHGALSPYLQGRGVELCPSLNYSASYFKPKANGAAFGYGYNLHLSTPLDQPRLEVEKVTRAGETVLFADAAQINTFQAPASPSNPMLEEFYYVSTNQTERTGHFRHGSTLNAVFCDGHVGQEKPLSGSIDPRMPRAKVGRLRPEILAVP